MISVNIKMIEWVRLMMLYLKYFEICLHFRLAEQLQFILH